MRTNGTHLRKSSLENVWFQPIRLFFGSQILWRRVFWGNRTVKLQWWVQALFFLLLFFYQDRDMAVCVCVCLCTCTYICRHKNAGCALIACLLVVTRQSRKSKWGSKCWLRADRLTSTKDYLPSVVAQLTTTAMGKEFCKMCVSTCSHVFTIWQRIVYMTIWYRGQVNYRWLFMSFFFVVYVFLNQNMNVTSEVVYVELGEILQMWCMTWLRGYRCSYVHVCV